MRRRVLIVEDDDVMARVLRDNLEYEGYTVDVVRDGDRALPRVKEFGPDLMILDLMLPGMSGFEICKAVARTRSTPIIVLTARNQKEDKIRGLEFGADDYVTKPVALDELLARVKAVLRRTRPSVDRLTLGDVLVDFRRMQAVRRGLDIGLTHKELEILRYLAEHPGHVVSRDELLQEVWGYVEAPLTRTVDNAVVRLRRKLEPDPHNPQFLRTAHGDGYRLTP
jgi:DNA-binding response OmpR family regulator